MSNEIMVSVFQLRRALAKSEGYKLIAKKRGAELRYLKKYLCKVSLLSALLVLSLGLLVIYFWYQSK